MKNIILAIALMGMFTYASADSTFHPSGSSLTHGTVSFGNRLLSQINNPASTAYAMEYRNRRWAVGLLTSFGGGVEFGQIDNFIDDLDRLSNELQRTNITPAEGNALVNEFNAVLSQFGDAGYVTTSGAAHYPGMPMVLNLGDGMGSFLFDINTSVQGRVGLLDSPVSYNAGTLSISTNSSLYIKGAEMTEYSFAYSRKFLDTPFGDLYGGAKAKVYRVGLTKSVLSISDANGDVGDVSQDRFETDFNETTAFSTDFGAMLVSKNYLLGASWIDVTEPTFDYNPVGQNCGSLSGQAQIDCNNAQSFGGEIQLNETFKLNTQLRLDASLFTTNKHWVLMGSLDSSPVSDPVGNEFQWFVLSGAYMSPNRLVPGVRAGYRTNLTGTKLSYATFGASFFKVLFLDLAYGLDKVKYDGDTMPRGVAFNLGLEFGF